MRIAAIVALCSSALAQDLLRPGDGVLREIAPGATQQYAVQLGAGDYVDASITRQGRTNVAVFRPNGVLLRRFPLPAVDGNRQFAFVAEPEGRYKIEVTNSADQPAKYVLRVDQITPLTERLRARPWTDRYPSPQLEALRKQIASGQTNTEAFWNRVAREGSPLVESLGSDGKYQVVTFLWRGTPSTQNVLVIGSFPGSRSYLDDVMHGIDGSDVWYLTK